MFSIARGTFRPYCLTPGAARSETGVTFLSRRMRTIENVPKKLLGLFDQNMLVL